MSKKKMKYIPPAFETSDAHGGYVALYRDLLYSPAFIALRATAKEVYVYLRSQYKGAAMGNKVKMPYSDFEKVGVNRHTLVNAIDMLECFGFISVKRGGLEHEPSEYTFSTDWKNIKAGPDVKAAMAKYKDVQERKKAAKIFKQKYKAELETEKKSIQGDSTLYGNR